MGCVFHIMHSEILGRDLFFKVLVEKEFYFYSIRKLKSPGKLFSTLFCIFTKHTVQPHPCGNLL